jgi:hypothetical protein
MRSFLQLLALTFWMRPLQRALVVLAVLVAVLALLLPAGIAPLLMLGMSLVLVSPLFTSGLLLRSLSAQRGIQMLPHARGRLLAGTIGLVLVASMLLLLAIGIAQHPVPPRYRPDAGFYALTFVLMLSFGTQLAIGIFIGSRSPWWALVVILALQAPGLVLRLAGVVEAPRLLATGPVGLVSLVVIWLVFGFWYMKAASISPVGWRGSRQVVWRGGSRALDQPADSREEAMRRWLLGALTPLRASQFWLAGACLLIAIQLLFGKYSPPPVVTGTLLATLSLAATGLFGIAYAIAQRSRGLWLTAGRDRAALYAWCERLMLRYVVHVALPFALVGLILSQLLPARPSLPGPFMALGTLAMMLAMAWLGLATRRNGVWVDLAFCLAIAGTWFYGLVLPLFIGATEPRWGVLAVQFAIVVAARQLAAWRWRVADWPRAQAPDPMG